MKQLSTSLLLALTIHLSYGQACGLYRINYIGSVVSGEQKIVSIQLPTIQNLHGLENENSKHSFIETTLNDGKFNLEIKSHLTTPFNDKEALLSYYKTQSTSLKIGVTTIRDNILKNIFVEVPWDDIVVSIIDDNKFGTLFEFRIKEIVI